MASMRDIKRRRESIQSTGQITKAMKLVSTVKLQKAKSKAENTKPYFEHMYKAVNSMLRKSGNILHPYLQSGSSEKKGIIMVTSNRGPRIFYPFQLRCQRHFLALERAETHQREYS